MPDEAVGRPRSASLKPRPVDLSRLPPVRVTSNKPSLWKIFLLGWQHFLPSLPRSTDRE